MLNRFPRVSTRLLITSGLTALALAAATTATAATVPPPAPGLAAGAASFGGSVVTPHVDIFYQQVDQSLIEVTSGTAINLGGRLTSGPAAFAQSPTEFVDEAVFARGGDNAIWSRQFSDGTGEWLPWTSLHGRARGAPAVTCFGNNAADPVVYVRGTDNALWRRPVSGAWTSYGGRLLSDPAARAPFGGSCTSAEDVFAIGTDHAVWERTSSAWRKVGGRSNATPAALELPSGEVDLFVRGTDDAVWMTSHAGGSSVWASWHRVGGALTSPVSAVLDTGTPNTRVVLGLGTDDNLWQGRNVVGTNSWAWSQVP